MIFHPQNLTATGSSLIFAGDVNATAHPCLNKNIIKEFWRSFSFNASALAISETSAFVFSVGHTKPLPLDGYAYSINIETDGVCVCAEDEKSLIHGFMTLLDRFRAIDQNGKTAVEIDCCQIKDKPLVQNRMVHICVFPETELFELQRFVRFCGALKYTHIVLEFWGMLKYDCLKELAWPHAFTKEQIRPIIREASELGLEVIPMFNHWGHAPASRAMHGKHVVLDQSLALQTYFTEDGWCWDIGKPKVRSLLRCIRNELIELCGSGSYFHIGCDEAYNFTFTKQSTALICDFINEVSDELCAQNRRAIAWGDMFLYRHPHYNPQNNYYCLSPSPEVAQYLLDHVSRKVLIADWQYEAKEFPVETSAVFLQAGFDCLLCPWDRGNDQMKAILSTVQQQSLAGYMHTTWHTLSGGLPYVTVAAAVGWEGNDAYWARQRMECTYTAALWRKVFPTGGEYEKAGWSKVQINSLC